MSFKKLIQDFQGKIFISACEPSADMYAAIFVVHLKTLRPDLQFIGIGGKEMAAAGVELLGDYRDLMAFGISATARHVRSNWAMYRTIARKIYHNRPNIFMPVAYPGINLHLCRYARSLGIRTTYLLPPQIWAWGGFRKFFIKKLVDDVISFFPFECEHYRRLNIPTFYVENPLKKLLISYRRADFTKTIGFMPGSRPSEIKRNFPVILKLIDQLKSKNNGLQFSIILRDETGLPQTLHSTVFKVFKDRYQAMKNCDLLITCSGTASLEATFLGIPQVFFNRPSWVDFNLMRHFISIKELNLANLYFGQKIVPVHIDRRLDHLIKVVTDDILKVFNSPTGLK